MSEADKWVHLFVNGVEDYAFILFDGNNCVTHWNPGAQRILGWSEQEIVGQSGAVFFNEDDRANGEVEKELTKAIQEGRAENERWHVRKDRTQFWASGVMTALRGDNGRILGFAKVLRDLTQRRQAEQALRESEERLRLFQESVRDYALFQVDLDGLICSWNSGARNLFDYSASEVIGKPFAMLFSQEDRDTRYPVRELERALRHDRFEDERWLVRKGGSRFWARWVTHPIRDREGRIRGFAKVLQDETRRKLDQERSRSHAEQERNKLLGQVQATATALDRTKEELRALAARLITAQDDERTRVARELHDDLAQQLALLQMQVEVALQGGDVLSPRTREVLEAALQLCGSISARVRNISHSLHPSVLSDLGLENALRNLREDFETAHGLSIRLSFQAVPETLPAAVALTIYRVTQEALRNVAKHASESQVHIRVSGSDDALYAEISDNGPGFDPEKLSSGQGLGLISMQERMHLIGGNLQVRSMPGSGTTIVATLPWKLK